MAEETQNGDRMLAVLAYLGPLVVVPLLRRRKQRFLFYHTRQGLYLFTVALTLFLVIVGLLYLFQNVVKADPVFRILSVLLLLEIAAYFVAMVILAILAGRGQMPMLPLLGDLAGEG